MKPAVLLPLLGVLSGCLLSACFPIPPHSYILENQTGKPVELSIYEKQVSLKPNETTKFVFEGEYLNPSQFYPPQFAVIGQSALFVFTTYDFEEPLLPYGKTESFQKPMRQYWLVLTSDMRLLARPLDSDSDEWKKQLSIEELEVRQPPPFPLFPKPDGVSAEEYAKQLENIQKDYQIKTMPPGEARDLAVSDLAGDFARSGRNFEGAVARAESIGDERRRKEVLVYILNYWLKADPSAATAAMQNSSLSADEKQQLLKR